MVFRVRDHVKGQPTMVKNCSRFLFTQDLENFIIYEEDL